MKKIIFMILAVTLLGTTVSAQGKRHHKAKSKTALKQMKQDSISARQDSVKIGQDSLIISQEKAFTAQQDSITAKQNAITLRQDSIAMFKQEAGAKISTNEAKFAELKAGIANEKKKFRAERGLELAKLEQKNIDLKTKLETYIEDGQDKWTSFKIEFNRAMDELSLAITDYSVVKVKVK